MMALIAASPFGFTIPPNSRMLVVFLLATVLAAGFSFLSSTAAAEGHIPFPFAKNAPIRFAVNGGFAVFVVAVLIGFFTYGKVSDDTVSSENSPHLNQESSKSLDKIH